MWCPMMQSSRETLGDQQYDCYSALCLMSCTQYFYCHWGTFDYLSQSSCFLFSGCIMVNPCWTPMFKIPFDVRIIICSCMRFHATQKCSDIVMRCRVFASLEPYHDSYLAFVVHQPHSSFVDPGWVNLFLVHEIPLWLYQRPEVNITRAYRLVYQQWLSLLNLDKSAVSSLVNHRWASLRRWIK